MHFAKLHVWKRSMDVVKEIYALTRTFPKSEQFALSSQMQRAAVSIPSNIAEGSQGRSERDFAHFILIAKGSLAELQTQIMIAQSLNYADSMHTGKLLQELSEIDRMLYTLHKKLMA